MQRKAVPSFSDYPFCVPAISSLDELELKGVTFFVGDNGSGKSTLLEAIAIVAGFNAEGGSKNFSFETAKSTSELHKYLRLSRGAYREATGFFLRAESYFNLATNIEELDREPCSAPPIIDSYGGTYLHSMSHGESFMALVRHRFGSRGLYILDEPESALSPSWQLSLLRHMKDLENRDSQFIVATHSPLLLAYPGARIYAFGKDGLRAIEYRETDQYRLYSEFLGNPDLYLRHLFSDD